MPDNTSSTPQNEPTQEQQGCCATARATSQARDDAGEPHGDPDASMGGSPASADAIDVHIRFGRPVVAQCTGQHIDAFGKPLNTSEPLNPRRRSAVTVHIFLGPCAHILSEGDDADNTV
ncbi:hypothetical protein [Pseudoscardovia suis]|uniref:Uncharacterized protein n=1 Tax=Pseudoscardovia suis TaxID=987063 RepID=A0A261EYQ1_9BIFI|nr:hypothetical protein [Pseudoscardovia suis]OZG51968.1 hypothetical protein PSSU_0751 [Pseudoscardovia suis]PJJ69434.1 hypothetical protein CLV65_0136 [Pseudoscardovia suis]